MMMMPMDAAVAKPENNGLKPGWSGALAGMMNLIRILPADRYDKLMADIRAGRIDPAQTSGMSMEHMNMPGMDHSKMDHSSMPRMDHTKMPVKEKSPAKKNEPTMEEQMKMDPNMKM